MDIYQKYYKETKENVFYESLINNTPIYNDNYVEWLEQQLNLTDVVKQRELLSRFLVQYNQSKLTTSDEMDIDLFLNDNKPT